MNAVLANTARQLKSAAAELATASKEHPEQTMFSKEGHITGLRKLASGLLDARIVGEEKGKYVPFWQAKQEQR